MLRRFREMYPDFFFVFCPFQALGDIYFCMSYLPGFMDKRNIRNVIVCVVGKGCKKTADLFDISGVETLSFSQKDLDAMIQAALFYMDDSFFIAHQDRPYIVRLHRALKTRCIPLEDIYRTGVFGLPTDAKPISPIKWRDYSGLSEIKNGKAVIISPYAKSVPALPDNLWDEIVEKYVSKGYQVFINVTGDEKPLRNTIAFCPDLAEMKSVVERAGIFIGIRSGMCDVLRTAIARKVALSPDYYYGDTKWKAIEMYHLDEFDNIVYKGDISEVLEAL